MKTKKIFIVIAMMLVTLFASQVCCFANDMPVDAAVFFTGIDEPTLGSMFPGNGKDCNPDIKLSGTDANNQYEITNISWNRVNPKTTPVGCTEYEMAGSGEKYILKITLKAKKGYYFGSSVKENPKFYIDGVKKEMYVAVTDSGATLECWYQFDETPTEYETYGSYVINGHAGYITNYNLNDVLGPLDGTAATIMYSVETYTSYNQKYDMLTLNGCGWRRDANGELKDYIALNVGLGVKKYSNGSSPVSGDTHKVAVYVKSSSNVKHISTDLYNGKEIVFVKASKSLYFRDNEKTSLYYCIKNFSNVVIEDTVQLYYEELVKTSNSHQFINTSGNVTIGKECVIKTNGDIEDLGSLIKCNQLTIGNDCDIQAIGIQGVIKASKVIFTKEYYDVFVKANNTDTVVAWDGNTELNNYDYIKMTPKAVAILSDPLDVEVADGKTATFTVTAYGKDLNYQWQYSRDNGKTWRYVNTDSAKTRVLSITASRINIGMCFRCMVYNDNGTAYSEKAIITVTSVWYLEEGKWYYYDSNGKLCTGWKQIGGRWFLFDENGVMLKGWQNVGGRWFLLHSDGYMITGWVQNNGTWWYLDPVSGAMATGWKQISNKWYYFNASGCMQVGWKSISGKWYYFNKDGDMKTGWLYDGGSYYYLNPDGDMRIGWLQEGSTWYYLKSDGRMACNETLKIGNVYYTFNSSGAWVK